MRETTTEKKATPTSTHSRLKPPTNSRNPGGGRRQVGDCPPKTLTTRSGWRDVAPTLKENKPSCRNNEGHGGKGEEESNRQHSEGGKQQQGLSKGGVAEEVLAHSGAEQLRYLLMRHNQPCST